MRNSFLRHLAQTSQSPDGFEVSRGQGIYLFDKDGRPFVDCISGITVSSLGHAQPVILDAIKSQLDLYLHTQVYGEYIVPAQVRLAEILSENLPKELHSTYFTNSGTEAVEGALKLARKYTRRYEIIACRNAYHGSTAGAESLRSDFAFTSSARPLVPGIRHIRFNELEDLQSISEHTAAVIIEPIQAEAGIHVPSSAYLQKLSDQCRKQGALLIVDEIQTGLSRTGRLWGFEHFGITPDVLLLAKAFGGGLPLGAFVASKEIMEVLAKDPPLGHLTTFGGNALSCAASIAVIQYITDHKLWHHVEAMGQLILERLSTHPHIVSIRGKGLFMALDLGDPDRLTQAIHACRNEGLLVDWFLFNSQSIRLAPPLVITEAETELLCEKMIRALDTL